MAETKFIKASAFGGYDKADVDKRLDFLYNLVYDLKNELRESRLLLKKYQENSDAEKNYETVLASERALMTQIQVKNENLSERNKCIKEEARIKENENAELREEVRLLQNKLSDAELSINAMKSQNSAEAVSIIFVEAQKSRELILNSAKKEAQEYEEGTKKFIEEFVTDTNNQASKIIYTAERQAAEIIADARNQAEQIRISANNLKAVMYKELCEVSSNISEIKTAVADFNNICTAKLVNAEKIIEMTDNTIKNGGIPVFEIPKEIKPDYPEEPVYQKPKAESVPEKKHNAELDKLQAMAESIGDNKPESKKSSISLDDLAKQAEALESGKKVSDNPAKSTENSGAEKSGLSLADLMKQAQALES